MSVDNWPHLAAESVREEARLPMTDLIGRPLRVVQFHSMVAKDYIPGRVTIYLDAKELISDVKVEDPRPAEAPAGTPAAAHASATPPGTPA